MANRDNSEKLSRHGLMKQSSAVGSKLSTTRKTGGKKKKKNLIFFANKLNLRGACLLKSSTSLAKPSIDKRAWLP